MPRRAIVVLVVAAIAGAWFLYARSDPQRPIKARLQSLSELVNRNAVDGLGAASSAVQLGAFLTEDVDVELGRGATPIRGRDTVIGMAARLQTRTAAFRLRFEDMSVDLAADGQTANVHLTAEFIGKNVNGGGESLDAREFTIGMRLVGDNWQIAKVTAVDTLK